MVVGSRMDLRRTLIVGADRNREVVDNYPVCGVDQPSNKQFKRKTRMKKRNKLILDSTWTAMEADLPNTDTLVLLSRSFTLCTLQTPPLLLLSFFFLYLSSLP